MTTTTKLTSSAVASVFKDCLFTEGEDTTQAVIVEGIMSKFGFHPDRLKANTDTIKDLLAELPYAFKESGGGGMSFLNACMTNDGEHWGEHINMEQLFALGLAIGQVTCLMPREFWKMLPGSMPYYSVKG